MATLGKFTTALMAGSQETTLALAALNFDFSLFKFPAPQEFEPLGARLSVERRKAAEMGQHHITARKLGALFRSELPKDPSLNALIGAYGRRASEIANAPDTTRRPKDPAFSEYAGFDGTGIWAAATSGREAICVQLLACLLAEFWGASEAISIWSELIETRKRNLASQHDSIDFAEIAALQANITREHLAEWDASARAWLCTANAVSYKRQTQLRLIAQNVQIDVSPKFDTYPSVIEAWISAMITVGNLVRGIPQQVQSGAILLGLRAWHLYPDLLVYGEDGFREVKQDDELIASGGLLTIGLEMNPNVDSGVSWSLSLKKLRYYGDPVVVKKAMRPDDEHIEYSQLMLMLLGSLLRSWQIDSAIEQKQVCKFLALLLSCCLKDLEKDEDLPPLSLTWMYNLRDACQALLSMENDATSEVRRLVAFGHRRCDAFLKGARLGYLLGGLLEPGLYVRSLKRAELRIHYLRQVAPKATQRTLSKDGEKSNAQLDWIIRYFDERGHKCFASAGLEKNFRWGARARSHPNFLHGIQSLYDLQDELESLDLWIASPEIVGTNLEGTIVLIPSLEFWKSVKNRLGLHDNDELFHSFTDYKSPPTFEFRYGALDSAALYERRRPGQKPSTRGLHTLQRPGTLQNALKSLDLNQTQRKIPKFIDSTSQNWVDIDVATKSLENDHIDPSTFIIEGSGQPISSCQQLRALSSMAMIYKSLPGARISVKITQNRLCARKWTADRVKPSGEPWMIGNSAMSRARAFACIGLFETGDTDLDPESLSKVMALSVGDSLYLAAPMLRDPSTQRPPFSIYRVLGNVGKPGMSLLIPPVSLVVVPLKLNDWKIANYLDYNGEMQNSFSATSLQLSLTEYRMPYAAVHEGARDVQTFFQEAVVSIYDGAAHVADVDILKSLRSNIVHLREKCPHITEVLPPRRDSQRVPRDVEQRALTTADTWVEILSPSRNATVARASGNWVARLAVAALGAQLGRTVYVAPRYCETCFKDVNFVKSFAYDEEDLVVC